MKKTIVLILFCLLAISSVADEIKYPQDVTENYKRYEYALAALEELRLQHNSLGKSYRDGKITKEEWFKYKDEIFDPMQYKILQDLNHYKDQILLNTLYEVAVDEIESNKSINWDSIPKPKQ